MTIVKKAVKTILHINNIPYLNPDGRNNEIYVQFEMDKTSATNFNESNNIWNTIINNISDSLNEKGIKFNRYEHMFKINSVNVYVIIDF